MPETWYLIAAVAIGGIITLLLRTVPFAILKPLRKSRFVQSIGAWMPAGLLVILAVVILSGEIAKRSNELWIVATAVVVTVAVHLLAKRHALLSITAGTATYVVLLNFFA